MAKKHWIYIKRGLSEDPKHRAAMGECIWLFMHIIDRADWETGIAYDWRDKEEAADMGLPLDTLRRQRQKLEEADYIHTKQKQHSQDVYIMEWRNPRDYGTEVKNPRNEGSHESPPSDFQGSNQGLNQGSNQVQAQVETPTSYSESKSTSGVDFQAIEEQANKEVDAILGLEEQAKTKLTYPKRESIPEVIRDLLDVFVAETGLKPRAKETMDWRAESSDWLSFGAQPEDVRGAVRYAKGKYTLSSPHSLTNTLRAYKAGTLATESGTTMKSSGEVETDAFGAPMSW